MSTRVPGRRSCGDMDPRSEKRRRRRAAHNRQSPSWCPRLDRPAAHCTTIQATPPPGRRRLRRVSRRRAGLLPLFAATGGVWACVWASWGRQVGSSCGSLPSLFGRSHFMHCVLLYCRMCRISPLFLSRSDDMTRYQRKSLAVPALTSHWCVAQMCVPRSPARHMPHKQTHIHVHVEARR